MPVEDSLKPGANPGANQPDGHSLIDPANEKAMSGDKLNRKSQPLNLARVTLAAEREIGRSCKVTKGIKGLLRDIFGASSLNLPMHRNERNKVAIRRVDVRNHPESDPKVP